MKNYYVYGLAALLLGCHSSKDQEQSLTKSATAKVAAPALTPQEQQHYAALTSRFVDSMFPHQGQLNGSILVAKNGVIVYERYTGFKNIRTRDTLTATTPLQIASTSKTLTSAAVLQLVQQGKLDLNTPVAHFFPGFPYDDVTVKMLLNHRSGLPEYLYFFEKNGWKRTTFATNNDVINGLINWKPGRAYRADTHFNYCNTNFVLLASIVEKVSGLPFPQYMKQYIFDPLQMNDTYVFTINDTARAAQSYNWNGSIWEMDFSDGTYGDKNVYSTPRDLLKWDQALYSGQVISPQLLDSAFTPYSNERPSMHNYGLGWRLLFYPNGKKVVYHNGRWHGFNSAFARLTDEKVTIIMLVNKLNKHIYKAARKMYSAYGPYDTHSVGDVE